MSAPTTVRPTSAAEPNVGGEFRYPGSPPFADSDLSRVVFHGRTREIDQVLYSILSFDLFVVYAISGLGKTSLLSAGVFEQLRERGLFPVMIRLNNPSSAPVELIDVQIREAGATAVAITVMTNPALETGTSHVPSLWDLLGALEIWRDNSLQRPVLVFDQFEELFTLDWSDTDREQFIEQLGQVLRRYRPASSEPASEALAALPPPDVKVVIVIREDFLGELEALATDMPQIMQHRFRLDGLQPHQAKEAICEPAATADARLASPRFTYSDGAAEAIVAFLGAREDRGRAVLLRSIDPCQLQIICQHVERSILPAKTAAALPGESVEITETDLGGKSGLERMLSDFYRRELSSFAPDERHLVRRLCETGLINQNGRRLSLEEGEIDSQFEVSKPMLDELVSRRLLRAEPRVGSVYYELAHDSLTWPILGYRQAERAAKRRRHRLWVAGTAAVLLVVLILVAFAAGYVDNRGTTATELPPEPRQISIGESLSGTEVDSAFLFEAVDEASIAIEVTPADAKSAIELIYPSGLSEEVGSDSDRGAVRVVLVHPVPGRYSVFVTPSATGSFTLSIQTTHVEVLTFGDGVKGTVGDGLEATYIFEPPDGQSSILELMPGRTLDAVLEVTDTQGETEASDRGGKGEPESVAGIASTGGPFRVAVKGFDASTGSFELTATPIDVVDLDLSRPYVGRIDHPGDISVVEIRPPPDQLVVVDVNPSSSLDAAVVVRGAGAVDASSYRADDGRNQQVIVADLPESSPARLVISGVGDSAGSFELSSTVVPPREFGVGETHIGSLDADVVAAFTLVVGQPTNLAIELHTDDDDRTAVVALFLTNRVRFLGDLGPYLVHRGVPGLLVGVGPGRYPVLVLSPTGAPVDFTLSVEDPFD